MVYNKDNFCVATKATWKGCKRPKRNPDYISYDRNGQVSSEYWYFEDYVIRCSSHWSIINGQNSHETIECGRVSSCYWALNDYKDNRTRCGKCYYKHFKGN